jgi:alcohol dehydrogenase class IV
VRFEFATATRIIFGFGLLTELGVIAAGMGCRALLVTGRTASRADAVSERFAAAGFAAVGFTVAGD